MAEVTSTLIRWHKGDGEFVQVDEPVCEMETGAAAVDVPAWASGILRHRAREGDIVSRPTDVARIRPSPADRGPA